MRLLFSKTFPLCVPASNSKVSLVHFHHKRKEVISYSEAWFVKVVSTLFVRSQSLNTFFGYLSKKLTPSISFEVIKRLNNNPNLGLKFFELSRANLSVNHSFSTYNLLIRSLCQMGFHDSAKFVFDCMRIDGHSPDNSTIEFLVCVFAKVGKLDSCEKLLEEIRASKFVYSSLFNVLVKNNKVYEAVCLFRKQIGSHFVPDTWTFNILIGGLCGVGEVHSAFEFFNDMGKFRCSPDVVTYNTLISGLCRTNEVDRGCDLLREVQLRGDFSPNVRTFTSVILGYCKLGRMEEASALFDEMMDSGTRPTTVTFNVLIDAFSKVGDMASAIALYEKMLFHGYRPDVVTFTSLIDGYCRVGQLNRGLKLWCEMSVRNVSPNGYTYSVVIHALCKVNRLHEARDLLRQLNCTNIVPKPFMYNPVIDGFCKAGNVDEANMIVAEMEEKRCNPDKMTFTILILGNCMKGRMVDAIGVFYKMLAVGCAPDKITVHCLMSCLLKAGMPNEAFHIKETVMKSLNVGMSSLRSNHMRAIAEIPMAV
ncbi:pentatricopeptide repeat-containing protein At2g06000 [Morus notabilis]|nr:pentatricopeptide repeat-containing protein At2g06000 [Morus notabilis]